MAISNAVRVALRDADASAEVGTRMPMADRTSQSAGNERFWMRLGVPAAKIDPLRALGTE